MITDDPFGGGDGPDGGEPWHAIDAAVRRTGPQRAAIRE
jgi:hypothetical protein